MIDIHSHVIFGVDDGAKTLEDSLKILLEANAFGITAVIATPHFSYLSDNKDDVIENFNILKEKSTETGVELFLASELMATPIINDALDACIQIDSGGKLYQLVEFPDYAFHLYLSDMIYRMQINKVTPIIAHPERNAYFQRNYSVLSDLSDKGCLLQIDAESFCRENGRARKLAKRLIKEKRASFISFDVHSPGEYITFMEPTLKSVKKWTDEDYAEELFSKNAERLLFRK